MEIQWNNKDTFYSRDLAFYSRLHEASLVPFGIIITRGSSMQLDIKDRLFRYIQNTGAQSIDDIQELVYLSKDNPSNPYGRVLTHTVSAKNAAKIQKGLQNSTKTFADVWTPIFCNSKFGSSTTNFDKMVSILQRGGFGAIPLVALGLPSSIIVGDK